MISSPGFSTLPATKDAAFSAVSFICSFTQRPKRIAPFEIECYSCPSRFFLWKWQSEAELFQIVFLSKMEYNETMNILPRLRLRYGRNLICGNRVFHGKMVKKLKIFSQKNPQKVCGKAKKMLDRTPYYAIYCWIASLSPIWDHIRPHTGRDFWSGG